MITFQYAFIRVAPAAALMLFLLFCRAAKPATGLKSIQLIVKYPLVTLLEGKLIHTELKDTITIDYYKNLALYTLPGIRRFENNEKIPGTATFFLFKKGDKYGFFLKNLDSIAKKRMLIDSFLNLKAFATARFDRNPADSLAETVQSSRKQFLLKYVPRQKENEMTFDSIYYHFNADLIHIDYTLSKAWDSTEHSKLCKVQLIHNAGYSPTYNLYMPKREFLFEIRQIASDSIQKKMMLFEELLKAES